jgi:hypothetical protein
LLTIGVAARTGGIWAAVGGRTGCFGALVGGAVGRLPASPVDGAIGRTDPGVEGLAAGTAGGAGVPGFDGLRAAGDDAPAAVGALDGVPGLLEDDPGFPAADPLPARGFGDPPPTAGGTAVIAGGRGGAIGLGGTGIGAGAGVSCT